MYVYGKNVVNELLKNKKNIKKAFIYNDFSDSKIVDNLKYNKVDIKFMNRL